jgi:hypothetical protein
MLSDGPRAYAPPPAPASLSYSQVPGWAAQPRTLAVYPAPPAASAGARADGAPGPLEVTPSVQLTGNTSGPGGPTPMLTITLPAVKFLVPITGSYSYAPAQAAPAAGETAGPATTAENTPVRAGAPSTPPTIQYFVPTVTGMQPTIQYTPGLTAGPSATAVAPAPAGPRADETVPVARPALTPPPPNWPRSGESVDGTATDTTNNPPPPPPIHRNGSAGPAGALPTRP